jgi:(4S)-4-hydroxy-5-phosphonooxypentane-2,3-dione isomerase
MYVVCVTVFVNPDDVDAFVEATRDNHLNTRQEPGNLRFDVLRAEDDPTRFFLYEMYRTKEAFASHQQTRHYLRWRESVAPLMAQPRQGVRHLVIFPSDEE